MWPSVDINSFSDYENYIDSFVNYQTDYSMDICYRGQIDASWDLIPSLWRMMIEELKNYEIQRIENESISKFQRKAHLILNPLLLPSLEDKLSWLAIMQHYNAPTRLLDWSYSPYVALYFAVQDKFNDDGAVWHFNKERLGSCVSASYQGKADLSKVFDIEFKTGPAEPVPPHHDSMRATFVVDFSPSGGNIKYATDRVLVQQGTFTVCRGQNIDHAKSIHEVMSNPISHVRGVTPQNSPKTFCGKMVVKSHAKRKILFKLNQMNINADSLFPGIDGLGRSIAASINTHQVFQKITEQKAISDRYNAMLGNKPS